MAFANASESGDRADRLLRPIRYNGVQPPRHHIGGNIREMIIYKSSVRLALEVVDGGVRADLDDVAYFFSYSSH